MDLTNLFNQKKIQPGLCSLYFNEEQLVLSYIKNNNNTPSLTCLETAAVSKNNFSNTLEVLIKKHNLNAVNCNWVLDPAHYQLLLIDAPKVPDEELKEALRWKVKDLIDFPVNDALIDFLKIPSPYREKLFVIAANRNAIKSSADELLECGFNLKYIDIPETCFRNLIALHNKNEEAYTGLLIKRENTASLIITFKNELMLAQFIRLSSNTPDNGIQNLTTEIQNGFTYCYSQQRIEAPKKLFLNTKDELLENNIKMQLDIETEVLSIQNNITLPPKITINQNYANLAVLGGAIRESF